MVAHFAKGWLSLAEETSNEMNVAKLARLVAELCRALEAEHEKKVQSVLTAHLTD